MLSPLCRHDLKIHDMAAASNPGAEAARRYRARKRGEDVPKRKPGPKPVPRVLESPVPLPGEMRREWARLWRKYGSDPRFRELVRNDLGCRCRDQTAGQNQWD